MIGSARRGAGARARPFGIIMTVAAMAAIALLAASAGLAGWAHVRRNERIVVRGA